MIMVWWGYIKTRALRAKLENVSIKNDTDILLLKVQKILLTFSLKSFLDKTKETGILKEITLLGLILGLQAAGFFVFIQ